MKGDGESDKKFSIGDRIEDVKDGERGTVRFVGEVPPTKGLWLGVEWDHPDVRGRHDGTHEGVRYFSTTSVTHPNSASFIRPTKVREGISLCAAVFDRYGAVEGETAGVDMNELNRLCREINAPFVEVVGFDKVNKKQSEFSKLRIVSVRRSGVSHIGPDPSVVGSMLPKVQNLDLSENLINSWLLVADIAAQLKHLKNLIVSDNRLSIPDSPETNIVPALMKLEQLIMGEMNYDWAEVLTIAGSLINLQLLHAPANRISTIEDFHLTPAFTNLIELNLNGNPLVDWSNVMKFGHLQHLRTLFINECGITSIRLDGADDNCFPQLRNLCMTSNAVNDWLSFAHLDRLKLIDLRCRSNPILDTLPPEKSRQILIASVSSVIVLNGTEIDRFERYGADIDYLKRYGLEYLAATKAGTLDVFYKEHPRYAALVTRYGAIEEDELKTKDTSIKSSLLDVIIDCPEETGFVKFNKKLPQTMTIQKLRLLLQRALVKSVSKQARAHELVLKVTSVKQPEVKVPLDNDMRDLFFYSVESGDTISVTW